MTLSLTFLICSHSFSDISMGKTKTYKLELQNGKQLTVKEKPPKNSTKVKATVSNDGSDYANTIDQCNLPEWQDHQTCEGKWIARMKTIIEDTEDDKKGKDYAEAANIWDSPKLQGLTSLSTLDHRIGSE